MKYLKFLMYHFSKIFVLFNLVHINLYSIDVLPQGKLIRKSNSISQNPTVQMYFDPNRPPVINITPGRPTIVQFPSEVRSCVSASNLVTITYADKTSSSSSENDKGSSSDSWFSAVIFNVGSIVQNGKISVDDILQIPETGVTCQIRISSPDSPIEQAYTWQTIGVKISNSESTYFVVYLLNQDLTSQGKNLPTEDDLIKIGAKSIDALTVEKKSKYSGINESGKKLDPNKYEEKIKKKIETNQKSIITDNRINTEQDNILNYFTFSDVSAVPK